MVRKKLIYLVIFVLFFFTNYSIHAEKNLDQWQDSNKTYKDLINEGFEVLAYDTNSIETGNGFIVILFVTVLQKDKEVFECQEYQTLDEMLETLNLSFVCRKLVQPYKIGVDT